MKRSDLAARSLVLLAALGVLGEAETARAWELFRSESGPVTRGNEHLEKGQFQEALEAYDEAARDLPNDPAVQLDRGLALLALGKLGEARESFRRGAVASAPKEVRGAALYNLGLAFMEEGDQAAKAEDFDGAKKSFEEAADAFRGSLRAQPGNQDAGWNLELAKRRLADVRDKQDKKKKEQEEQQKKDQQDKQDKDEQSKDQQKQNQDDQQKDQQGDGKGDDQPDGGTPEQGDGGAQKPEQPEQGDAGAQKPEPEDSQDGKEADAGEAPPEASPAAPNKLPEHMTRALDALEAGEENLEKHRARQRARTQPRRIEKDW